MDLWSGFNLISYLLVVFAAPSVLLEKRGRPLSAIGWLLAMVFIPIGGVMAWWLWGRNPLGGVRKRRLQILHYAEAQLAKLKNGADAESSRVELLIDGEQIHRALETAIKNARHSIHLLFYIWRGDKTGRAFRDLLIEKAQQGVEVRLLCDRLGSPALRGGFLSKLKRAGGLSGWFSPQRFPLFFSMFNSRNHRKIVLVDGKTAFLGSFNIGDEYRYQWHDVGLKVQGDLVDQLQSTFAADWLFSTGEDLFNDRYFGRSRLDLSENLAAKGGSHIHCRLIADGPDLWRNSTRNALFTAINEARARVWLTTPYFIPDEAVIVALETAVRRGVDVRLLLPLDSDVPVARLASRCYFPELLEAGVRIYEYEPAVLHAKAVVLDDQLSILGSANLDFRSFRVNFEVSVLIENCELNAALAKTFLADLALSRELTLHALERRHVWERVMEATAHLFSPLL
ncbi:cardiolipin synthase [Bdellovibrionota bacterium FG-2]